MSMDIGTKNNQVYPWNVKEKPYHYDFKHKSEMKAVLNFMCHKRYIICNMFSFLNDMFSGGFTHSVWYMYRVRYLAIEPSCWKIGFANLFTCMQFGRQHFPYLKIFIHDIDCYFYKQNLSQPSILLWHICSLLHMRFTIPHKRKIFCNRSANEIRWSWLEKQTTALRMRTLVSSIPRPVNDLCVVAILAHSRLIIWESRSDGSPLFLGQMRLGRTLSWHDMCCQSLLNFVWGTLVLCSAFLL